MDRPSHAHHHSPVNSPLRVMTWAILLNLLFAIIEFLGGAYSGSLSIMSNAFHDFGDAGLLCISVVLEFLANKSRDEKHTYGARRYSTIAALMCGMMLIVGSLFLMIQSVSELKNPSTPYGSFMGIFMLAFALLGLVVNMFSFRLMHTHHGSHARLFGLHFLQDTLGWSAVLIGAIGILFFNLYGIDPILSILINIGIIWRAFKELRLPFNVLLQKAPSHLHPQTLQQGILKIPGVKEVHDTHLWSLDGELHVFSGHVVVESSSNLQQIFLLKQNIRAYTKSMGIHHTTIEIEGPSEVCEKC